MNFLFAALIAVLLRFLLKLLAKHRAFHWLEHRGSDLRILNPFPAPRRYIFVYLGALMAFLFVTIFFRR